MEKKRISWGGYYPHNSKSFSESYEIGLAEKRNLKRCLFLMDLKRMITGSNECTLLLVTSQVTMLIRAFGYILLFRNTALDYVLIPIVSLEKKSLNLYNENNCKIWMFLFMPITWEIKPQKVDIFIVFILVYLKDWDTLFPPTETFPLCFNKRYDF